MLYVFIFYIILIIATFVAILYIFNRPYDSSWYAAFFCNHCNQELNRHERYYSNGMCPRCGVKSGYTIVDTYTKAFRYLPRKNKWNVFEKQQRIFKDNV